jgi:hypothetical protein
MTNLNWGPIERRKMKEEVYTPERQLRGYGIGQNMAAERPQGGLELEFT